MKLNRYTVAGLMYITYIIILTIADIGKTPSCEPFEWWIAILMAGTVLCPFILGYMGGKE